jgi:hypothetical protein
MTRLTRMIGASPTYRFGAVVWMHPGAAGWHFVTLPPDIADEIDELTAPSRRGFGSVAVQVTVGATSWHTSIFPDRAAQSFVLPVKRPVRTAEGIAVGDRIDVLLRLVR